ncbi:MAG TPA: cytochrome c [Steroidobacteraceae bacterium]
MNPRNNSKKLYLAGIAAIVSVAAGAAFASSIEETIKTRQAHLKDLGEAFKEVRDQLRNSQPDLARIKTSADTIANAATQMPNWFPQGSGPESKVKTDAKPEIWADPAGFEKALKNFQGEAPKLQQLAAANDVSGIRAQVGKLGGACKNCHDNYRVRRD